ncbi:MAG: DUF1320 domain-containing protein [Phycisphaerales bacterium]|nr:DUF1320 domain-containing protein [Phycisphaerales bacterium]MCB9855273.1 DUF1320 domain-containing protein [Phycisphaerales bacterium]MCB9862866.1 DUF1320 domain-containing protein [Phycisphaerales bacterium]
MSYATLDDLKQRLGKDYAKLTDRVAATTADDDVGTEILAGAHGTIDGYLVKRYLVPVDSTGAPSLAQFLKQHVLNIASYIAWESNPFRKDIPERITLSRTQTIDMFRDIAAGKLDLPGVAPIPSGNAAGPSAEAVGEERVFTMDAMEGL